MRDRGDVEIIAGQVSASGYSIGDGWELIQNSGSGSYTIHFKDGFRPISCVPTPTSAGAMLIAHPSGYTEHSVDITVFTLSTGAGTNNAFSFICAGVRV